MAEARADGTWSIGVKKMTLSVSASVVENDLCLVDEDEDPLRQVKSVLKQDEIVEKLEVIPLQEPTRAGVMVLEEGEIDPLSAMLSTASVAPSPTKGSIMQATVEMKNEYLEEWTIQKENIFQEHAGDTFKVKIDANEDPVQDESVKKHLMYSEDDGLPQSSSIRKARARLEHLEKKPDANTTTIEVSKNEYIDRVKALQSDFVKAWSSDQKVLALRIAIKCFKLLGDVSFPKLYPCLFVLVSDVLDCFSTHVYERIKAKAEETLNKPLPCKLKNCNVFSNAALGNFTSNDISIEAKETCRNWFYKTACIRELLPRIYTEIALLQCYRFLCDGEYPQIVSRLSNMIRGIGNPTIALYTRMYLALASSKVLPPGASSNPALLCSMQDYMYSMHRFSLDHAPAFYAEHEITEGELRAIHSPAVEWLAKGIALYATGMEAELLLAQYKQYPENGMILSHLIKTFPSEKLAEHTMAIVYLIKQTTGSKVDLYRCLCSQLVHAAPPEADKLAFLNEVWGTITQLTDIHAYLTCATGFIQLLVAHYSSREVIILLKDIVRHLNTAENMDAKMYSLLQTIMSVIILEARRQLYYFSTIITSSEFLTLLGMFRHMTSIALSKRLLETFVRSKKNQFRLQLLGPHAAIVQILFSLSVRVHDALDSLSARAEINETSSAICNFLLSLEAPNTREGDEAMLQIFMDARSAFYKLDKVKQCLVRLVLRMSVLAYPRIHMSSSRNYVKGCLAYCHITIPSLMDPIEKLRLMTSCSKIALLSHCLPQMDAFVKASIVLMTEIPSSEVAAQDAQQNDPDQSISPVIYESQVMNACLELLSLLIAVPSLSMESPLYFYHGFYNAMTKLPLSNVNRLRIQIQLLPFLSACAQETLPYHIGFVESNEVLFGGSRVMRDQINTISSTLIEDISQQIAALEAQVDLQCDLALDFLNQLMASVDITHPLALERLLKLLFGVYKHHSTLHNDIKQYWCNTRDAFVAQAQKHMRRFKRKSPELHARVEGLMQSLP